jgi:hypothetical protein
MKTRTRVFIAILGGCLMAGAPAREAWAIDFCPTIFLILTNITVTGSQVTACAEYVESPGSYKGQAFTYPYKRWSWVVKDIKAEPQEGLGPCAVYSNANGDVGNIHFTLTNRTRLWPHCNNTPSIGKKIIVNIDGDGGDGLRKGKVYNCSDETRASLCLTENSYSENGFIWSSNPSGLSGEGQILTYNPSEMTPGTYTVRVKSADLEDCYDECDVNIIKVDIAMSDLMVCKGDSMASLRLTASSYSPGGFTWSSEPAGISGVSPSNTITFNADELAPGTYTVTAESVDLSECFDVCVVNIRKVNLIAYGPGTMTRLGTEVPEESEDQPESLQIMVNDDHDDEIEGNHQDNQDKSIGDLDDDIVAIKLLPLDPPLRSGTMALSVYPADRVRIYKSDGTAPLAEYSVDLSNPQGDLSALVSAPVMLYLEGMEPGEDVSLGLTYTGGRENVRMGYICRSCRRTWMSIPRMTALSTPRDGRMPRMKRKMMKRSLANMSGSMMGISTAMAFPTMRKGMTGGSRVPMRAACSLPWRWNSRIRSN